jgi:hypothetical protein
MQELAAVADEGSSTDTDGGVVNLIFGWRISDLEIRIRALDCRMSVGTSTSKCHEILNLPPFHLAASSARRPQPLSLS